MAQKFLKKEAISFGWDKMKEHFWFLVVLLIVSFLINLIPNSIATFLQKDYFSISIIFTVISWIVQIIISLGFLKIFINIMDGKEGKISDLFKSYKLFFHYLFSSILYALITFVGFILLIVPGIIWSIQFQFFGYFIVDKGAGPIEALKMSSRATKGAKWNLFLFGLLIGLINLVGMLCLLIGLFATVPATLLATAYVYRKLSQQMETVEEPVQTPATAPVQ